MKSVLVTGGAGFIGSNFVSYFLETHSEYNLVNLDALTYAANLDNVDISEDITDRYTFVEGSICDRKLVESIFEEYDIKGVLHFAAELLHFAAESHVDNSIKNPGVFIETNVTGTFTLIDVAFKKWMEKPFVYKKGYENCRFLHVSTDEVYGTLGKTGLFTESTPYVIVRSYHHTYGMNTIITNCSNNYGPKQHNEKLIPTIIRKALLGEAIPIYGDGKNIRDWLYVLDHCKGIDIAFHKGVLGEVYNIGGRNEKDNLYIVNKICSILDVRIPKENSYSELITFVEDRAGHDRRYAIDATKIEQELGWKADENFETGIEKTIDWYIDKYTE